MTGPECHHRGFVVARTAVVLAIGLPWLVAAGPDAAPQALGPQDQHLAPSPPPLPDCDGNASADPLDLVHGFATDCDGNDVLDSCDGFGADPEASVPQDACAAAQRLCPDIVYWGDTETASGESILLCDGQFGLFDVWYRYRPVSDGALLVLSCASDAVPIVSLHAGCPLPGDDLAVACDGAGDCVLVATVEAGVEYRLRFAMPGAARGAFSFTLYGPACAAPASPLRRAVAGSTSVPPLELAEAAAAHLGIATIPVAYNSDIDADADGVFEPADALALDAWIDANVPPDHQGPVVLDYEQPWWGVLSAQYVPPSLLEQILEVYLAVLTHAQQRRPLAQWGFWGLPLQRHLSAGWATQGLSVGPLLMASDAIFPALHDCQPGFNDAGLFTQFMTGAIGLVQGERPVHVFVWPRACSPGQTPPPPLLDRDEVLSNVAAALAAAWSDGRGGAPVGVDGFVLWDSTEFAPTIWDRIEMDQAHACLLRDIDAMARLAGLAP